MSTAPPSPRTDQSTCSNCGQRFDNGYNDDYCSVNCLFKKKGTDALRNVEQDHRFCSSCYRIRKEIYRPDESVTPDFRRKPKLIRDAFVGFEHHTEHVEMGPYGLECECGTVGSRTSEDLYRNSEAFEWWLKLVFDQLNEEGQLEQSFDLEIFVDRLWKHDNLERAVGEALYGK